MSANVDVAELPLVPAAVAGVVTWVLGYVFTYVLVGTDVRESNLNRFIEAFEGDPATYELVGWVFYNAHFVDVVYAGFGGRFMPASYVGGEDGFTALLYVVPPVLLVAAGLAVGRYQGVTETNDGAVAGALVLPGYLVCAIAGASLFEVSAAGTTGQPDLLAAFFLAGLVYPLVFGAVGGVVAAVTAEEEPAGRRTPS
jgi:hypothetical protein